MNLFEQLRRHVLGVVERLQAEGALPADVPLDRVVVEPPRDPSHGDAATNVALILAKPARSAPMALAARFADELRAVDGVIEVEAAKPGFVNLRLADRVWLAQIGEILALGRDYGAADLGRGRPVNVEFCSANPTGPLHVGHGRGTVFGDALANLLERTGFAVTREFYVNDSGAQIERLARSVRHRYLEVLGDTPDEPAEWYRAEELIQVARALVDRDGGRWRDAAEADWLPVFRDEGVRGMLALIKEDLHALGVHHDVFTSQAALEDAGAIEAALETLAADGLVYTGALPPPKGKPIPDYEPVPLLLFRATAFGDDSDRPLKSSRGEWTYFAADLAYHLDKIKRGAAELIDVLGADHGGYVKRMQAGVRALGRGEVDLDIKICQLVNLMDAGQPLKMSKRAGRILNLRDVLDEVGKGVFRFIILTRRNDAPLDFDFQKVTEQSRDNPVWYVQYAHARICSVERHAAEAGFGSLMDDVARAPIDLLVDPAELDLVRRL
ncbi:MAG: arginine--tRNA ligase, partial [Geminicoccaceae bacterium]|nr:arginine--tRNA ligase [Geminicoccaceae bacterium]